jgi:hypothetical protein
MAYTHDTNPYGSRAQIGPTSIRDKDVPNIERLISMIDIHIAPSLDITFNFETALKWLRAGYKLTRDTWQNAYLQIEDGELKLHLQNRDGIDDRVIEGSVWSDSILAIDWRIVDPDPLKLKNRPIGAR